MLASFEQQSKGEGWWQDAQFLKRTVEKLWHLKFMETIDKC